MKLIGCNYICNFSVSQIYFTIFIFSRAVLIFRTIKKAHSFEQASIKHNKTDQVNKTQICGAPVQEFELFVEDLRKIRDFVKEK
jgi:hypothetical protein